MGRRGEEGGEKSGGGGGFYQRPESIYNTQLGSIIGFKSQHILLCLILFPLRNGYEKHWETDSYKVLRKILCPLQKLPNKYRINIKNVFLTHFIIVSFKKCSQNVPSFDLESLKRYFARYVDSSCVGFLKSLLYSFTNLSVVESGDPSGNRRKFEPGFYFDSLLWNMRVA